MREIADQETFSKSAVTEDLRFLATAIESNHPDPYRGYGGRLPFHRRLERLVEDVPAEATAAEFHEYATSLLSGIKDGHTALSPPDQNSCAEALRLPVSLRVIGEGIFVDGVYTEIDTDILGGRLTAVNGVSVRRLAEWRNLRVAENPYMKRTLLANRIESYAYLDRLLDQSEQPEPVVLSIDSEGQSIDRPLEPIADDANPVQTLPELIERPGGSGPRYRLYEDGAGAVFVPGDLQGYRESLEAFMTDQPDIVEELAPQAYERHVGDDPPADRAEMVATLPSMMETLADLATDMEDVEADTLVVDLRDNPGGDSTFVFHIIYVLFGWDAVARSAESVTAVKRRTENHRERYGPPDENEPTTADRNPADFDFGEQLAHRDSDRSETIEMMRKQLCRSETFARVAADDAYAGYYQPPALVVLTSAETFSSGFAGVAQLSTLGADVIGVPSGQAPISYGEPISLSLPNTGLSASISCAAFEWLPDPSGDTLVPDCELTPERFEHYDGTGDASLQLAFDYAGITADDPPEPL